jgi:Ca-activated chloride channel family protein
MFLQPLIPVIIVSAITLVLLGYQFFKQKNRKQRIHIALRGLAVLLILVAGLRPSVPSISGSEVYNSKYDIYLVVDLTSSMVAEDWDGEESTRLDGVREDINDLLDDYVGAKFSLITFNSTANLRVPLTPDSTAIASAVNTMLPEVTIYSKGSSISTPVELLETTLTQKDEEDADRANIVLYFGDGEQTSSEDPESFESLKKNVEQSKVYGYGTEEGGRMKIQTGYYVSNGKQEYIQDNSGKDGLSIINEENLKAIANQLGGEYEHRTVDGRIQAIDLTDDQKLGLKQEEGSSVNNTQEFYWIFLIPVALIMIVEAAFMFRAAKLLGVKRK